MKDYSRQLRQAMTDAEKALWYQLRDRRFCGYKFRRQHCVEQYIIDFYCADRKCVIELDGGQHTWQDEKDRQRTAMLDKVIRFWNNEVLQNLQGVLTVIKEHLSTPHPSPLPADARRGDKDSML